MALIMDGTIAAPVVVGEGASVVLPPPSELVTDVTVVALAVTEASPLLDPLRPSAFVVERIIDVPRSLELVTPVGCAVVETSELEMDRIDWLEEIEATVELPSCSEVSTVAREEAWVDVMPVVAGSDALVDIVFVSELVGETIKSVDETAVPITLEASV